MLKEAVLNNLPQETGKAGFYLADEADLINQLVFGMTAKQWRKKYPNLKGNMRDNATIEQLLLVTDLQVVDSLLLKWDWDKEMRMDLLEKFAQDLRRHFVDSVAVQRIKEIQDKALKWPTIGNFWRSIFFEYYRFSKELSGLQKPTRIGWRKVALYFLSLYFRLSTKQNGISFLYFVKSSLKKVIFFCKKNILKVYFVTITLYFFQHRPIYQKVLGAISCVESIFNSF